MFKIIIATAAVSIIVACPPAKKLTSPEALQEKVLLRYKFPGARTSRYRVEENSVGKFSMSMMPVFQHVRARNSMVVIEKVVQRPVGSFATIARKIESLRLQVWRNDSLLFDSSRLNEFSDLPEAKQFAKFRKKVVRFEINELGKIRNIEGFGGFNLGAEPMQPMHMIQTGNPLLPEDEVRPTMSWKDKREISFNADQGYHGVIEIAETVTFDGVRKARGHTVVILSTRRNMNIKVYQPDSHSPWKGFKGKGQMEGKFAFGMEEGRIFQSETRSSIKVSSRTGLTTRIDTSTELNFSSKTILLR